MRYIAYWTMNPEDMDAVIKKFQEAIQDREKGSKQFPPMLFESHTLAGEWKGFILYEDATPEQLANVVFHYSPVMRFKFLPILKSADVIANYMRRK